MMATHSQVTAAMAMTTGAKCKSGTYNSARTLALPSTTRLQQRAFGVHHSTVQKAAKSMRKVTVSVLEASRVETPSSQSVAPNPSEVLLEKLAAMGKPNDTELHKMSDLADRLFLWDDVPKLGTFGDILHTTFVTCILSNESAQGVISLSIMFI